MATPGCTVNERVAGESLGEDRAFTGAQSSSTIFRQGFSE